MSQPAASHPARQLGSSRPGNRRPPAGQPGAPHFKLKCCTFQFEVSCGGVYGTAKMRSPYTPLQLDLKLKSAPFQFGNGVQQDRHLVASGCLAGCWPAAWLAGWLQSGSSAGGLAVSRENQRGWLTSNCLARRSVLALIGFGGLLSMHRIAGQTRLHDLAFRFGWRFK